MLGRLAKWLRVMGYDTTYSPSMSDPEAIREAKARGAVLVTRDKGLAAKARAEGVETVLVGEDLESQLKELADRGYIDLRIDLERTRCPLCNARLVRVERVRVRRLIPEAVANRYEDFWFCPRCRKVYWPGSHLRAMRALLKRLREQIKGG